MLVGLIRLREHCTFTWQEPEGRRPAERRGQTPRIAPSASPSFRGWATGCLREDQGELLGAPTGRPPRSAVLVAGSASQGRGHVPHADEAKELPRVLAAHDGQLRHAQAPELDEHGVQSVVRMRVHERHPMQLDQLPATLPCAPRLDRAPRRPASRRAGPGRPRAGRRGGTPRSSRRCRWASSTVQSRMERHHLASHRRGGPHLPEGMSAGVREVESVLHQQGIVDGHRGQPPGDGVAGDVGGHERAGSRSSCWSSRR